MKDQDFDPVAEAFLASLVYRMSRMVIQRSAVAADESASLNRWHAIARWFASLSVQRRIQSVALAIAIASLAHLGIRELLPAYATSGLPWWWNVTAAGFAMVVAMLAGPISAASADSTPAKVWRRFTA